VICIARYKSLKNFSTEIGSSRKKKLMQQYPSSIWMNLFLSWLVEEMDLMEKQFFVSHV